MNMQKEYYAELDEEFDMYCVFDTESSHAYASYCSIEQAEEKAREMNLDCPSKNITTTSK